MHFKQLLYLGEPENEGEEWADELEPPPAVGTEGSLDKDWELLSQSFQSFPLLWNNREHVG